MKLYRTIGYSEFYSLIAGKKIKGRYMCSSESQVETNANNVVMFYLDDKFAWFDANHKISIVIEVPDKMVGLTVGTYYVSDNVKKTGRWTGRNGFNEIKVNEGFIKSYSIDDVISINLNNHFASWFVAEILTKKKNFGWKAEIVRN